MLYDLKNLQRQIALDKALQTNYKTSFSNVTRHDMHDYTFY